MKRKYKKKIVMADDSEELCELVKMALEREGYEVDTVYNGLQLIAYLKKHQEIDAVILDLVMPERGGVSVFETIRSISPASKIIIYSGYTDYRDTVYGREADAFINKTDGVQKILQELERLI